MTPGGKTVPAEKQTRLVPWRPTAVLAASGLASAGVYLLLTVRMSLQRFFPGPGISIDFQRMLGPNWRANTLFLYGSFAVLLALWLAAIAAVRRLPRRTARLLVFGMPVLFIAVLASMYPPLAVDFFLYLSDGRLLWIYGANPMTSPVGAHFPVALSFGNQPSPYGPLWHLLLAPPVLFGGDSYLRSLILLKLWMGGFYLACAALTWAIARRLAPGRESLAVVLLAWNPFVVIRVLGNGHNDVVMMFFVLLALWAALHDRWRLVPIALAASVLIKYVSLLLAPAFLVCALRRPAKERGRAVAGLATGTSVALLLTVTAFAPFWQGLATFNALRQQANMLITSTPLLLDYQLRQWLSLDSATATALATRITTIVFLSVGLVLFVRQRPGATALVATAAGVMLAYTLIAVGWFRPWYLLWVVLLTPLLSGRWWLLLTVTASAAGLLPDVIEQYRAHIGWLRPHDFWLLAAPVAVTFLPPLLVWLLGLWRTRRLELDAGEPASV